MVIKYIVTREYQPCAAFDTEVDALDFMNRALAKETEEGKNYLQEWNKDRITTTKPFSVVIVDQTPWWS